MDLLLWRTTMMKEIEAEEEEVVIELEVKEEEATEEANIEVELRLEPEAQEEATLPKQLNEISFEEMEAL